MLEKICQKAISHFPELLPFLFAREHYSFGSNAFWGKIIVLFSLLFSSCTALISICVVIYFCISTTYASTTFTTHVHSVFFFSLFYEYSLLLVKLLSFYDYACLS